MTQFIDVAELQWNEPIQVAGRDQRKHINGEYIQKAQRSPKFYFPIDRFHPQCG